MTLLVSWVGIDTHGTSSLYIASDSRLSWDRSNSFDAGRKVFAFTRWPDVLGYCGDVLFPSLALNQIVDLADAGLLFAPEFSPKQKFQAIVDKLNDLASEYPALRAGLAKNKLTIVHGSRHPKENSVFFCHSISWTSEGKWRGEEKRMPVTSDVLFALGTGATAFNENYLRYRNGPTKGTSRAVFHCFCDTLANSTDHTVGGPPQLVGLIRKPDSTAFTLGVIHDGKRTFLGAHVDNLRNFDKVQWRNANFELCDARKMEKLPHAQPQPDPLRRQ
ncbi:hypothetical protein E2K99_02000 [Herbaspirillum huttiense]|uniref:hypothetical protein n=1 Tax=Herbaspirillum huttiense TaxID=863372 RepID=UPI001066392E|nr:hypothetical protein [Herbaspirillum huttiense]QBP73856.1 hypothetical protein E2K99_02000 [Herbaspirillum huttiense]